MQFVHIVVLKYELHLPNRTTQVIVNGNIQKNFSWKTHFDSIILLKTSSERSTVILHL